MTEPGSVADYTNHEAASMAIKEGRIASNATQSQSSPSTGASPSGSGVTSTEGTDTEVDDGIHVD